MDIIDSPYKLRQVIENAEAGARLRRERDPDLQAVAFFGVPDFLEALAGAIIRCRPPEPGFDPKGIIFHLSDMLALFEHRLIEHMDGENRYAGGDGSEFEFPRCFHGTSLRALEVSRAILSTISKFAIYGQGPNSYDVEAVEQNMLLRFRDFAYKQRKLAESA